LPEAPEELTCEELELPSCPSAPSAPDEETICEEEDEEFVRLTAELEEDEPEVEEVEEEMASSE
jgi:hypothetical protein